MAEEALYSSATADTPSMKRKYDDEASPQSTTHRRTTGFSNAPVASPPPDSAPSYKNVPPPVDDFQIAKQKAQEIAARLLLNANPADVKRPRVDSNNGGGYESNDKFSGGGFSSSFSDVGYKSSSAPSYGGSYGFQGSSKKIDIPNGRVGVIIGKGGETIKYLQLQSGAKIQVTRDAEADPNSPNRLVELTGTPDQITKAEQLINEVLSQADAGGSNQISRRLPGQSGGEQFVMKVPNNKVGLVIGKGGETIKNMQATTGARIQVIPLHLPPGDTSIERTVQIDGTNDQIEHAKQLVNEVISENRARNPSMGGGNPQGYGSRPQGNWGQSGGPPVQQQGYGGYMQPAAYPGSAPHYNMPQGPYGGYPPQPASGGYPSGWEQSSASQGQQGSGYDYYGQHVTQQQQPQGASGSADGTAYNYSQPPSGYGQQSQGYPQGSYGGYHAPQPGYDTANSHPGYDQQQGFNAATYGSGTNTNPEANTQSYGAQGDTSSAPPAQPASVGQQGYNANPNQQPSPNSANYASQASAPQTGYGVPPPSQPAYGGSQPPMQPGYGSGYGPPQGLKPLTPAPVYGQTQQSPNAQGGNYAQPGYPPAQPPPVQAGYAQADPAAQRGPPSSYGTPAAQPGYGQPSYNAPPNSQAAYGQQPPYNGSYGSGYPQASAYPADASSGGGSTRGAYEVSSTTQAAAPLSGKTASPSS